MRKHSPAVFKQKFKMAFVKDHSLKRVIFPASDDVSWHEVEACVGSEFAYRLKSLLLLQFFHSCLLLIQSWQAISSGVLRLLAADGTRIGCQTYKNKLSNHMQYTSKAY